MIRLPKQWRHWCKTIGLKPTYKRRLQHSHWNLSGLGRQWRVNCHGMFQMSCREEDFDRWANSQEAEVPLPGTLAEFKKAVAHMLISQGQVLDDGRVVNTLDLKLAGK